MGVSTVQQLINRAKNMNGYNNSGIATDAVWVDFFNAALVEMTDDLTIEEIFTINFTPGTREYNLPSDFYAISVLYDQNGSAVAMRRNYNQRYPNGYWVLDKGDRRVIDLYEYTQPMTFTLLYRRYPKPLTYSEMATQKPEVPTAGEIALCYKAIYFACLNNNQIGQAEFFDQLYQKERTNIKTAASRARGV